MRTWVELMRAIVATAGRTPSDERTLIGISGIDGSGKGFVASRIAAELAARCWSTATINVDGWLNLPAVRFSQDQPGRHFYQHGLRLDELFGGFLLPARDLKRRRFVYEHVDEQAVRPRSREIDLGRTEIVIVEGIFLFQPKYRHLFDLRIWIDCTFNTALHRAIARGQEGLSPRATVRAYETIYFPAQRIHLRQDAPRDSAHLVWNNERTALTSCS